MVKNKVMFLFVVSCGQFPLGLERVSLGSLLRLVLGFRWLISGRAASVSLDVFVLLLLPMHATLMT